MNMQRIAAIIGMGIFLSGCAANGFYEGIASGTPENAFKETEKNFIGVPMFLSMEGSSVKYNNEWRVTVAHNKPLLIGKEVYYHPKCDFAIFRDKSEGEEPVKGYVHQNQTTYHTGYPIGMIFSSHKGSYIGEIIDTRDDCTYSASDTTMISGMSGGGVYNKYGELVGVNVGIMFGDIKWEDGKEADSPGVFMSINRMKDFIEEVTGEKVAFSDKTTLEFNLAMKNSKNKTQ